MRLRRIAAMTACVMMLAPVGWTAVTEEEIRIGKEAEAEVAKQFKVVTDPAYVERVQRIGAEVAAVADEKDLTYKFTVLDVPDVNAFSLPNGSIYVYKGLVDLCESDDELAGVLAHEVAHASQHHLLQLIRKQKKFDIATIAAVIVGAAAGANIGPLAQASQLLTLGVLNTKSQKLESEADLYGVNFIQKTRYNPVGMLTFMERLARQELSSTGRVDYGIYRTHPLSKERSKALASLLTERGVTINRRAVMKSLQATPSEVKVGDKEAAQVSLGARVLFTVAPEGDLKALDRAKALAERLNKVLSANVNFNDVAVGPDKRSVTVRRTLVYEVTDADSALLGKPAEELAEEGRSKLKNALWSEYIHSIPDR